MNEKFFNKGRYMRNGHLSLTLLSPELMRFCARMGYYDKKTCCEVFEFVAELLRENMEDVKGVALKKVTRKADSKKANLPHDDGAATAKAASKKVNG